MPDVHPGAARRVVLLVGTTKGAFFLHSDEHRQDWTLTGPHLGGWEVFSLLGDSRQGRRRIYAGTHHQSGGATIQVSDDMGASWRPVEEGPRFTPMGDFDWEKGRWIPNQPGTQREWRLNRFWQLVQGHDSQPDTVFAGSEEAALFVSHDAGEHWTELSGLTAHPTRPDWGPGAAGMGLHTILVHPDNPDRMWVAASAVGVFRTDDAGATWQTCNAGLDRQPVAGRSAEIGYCAHKIVLDPDDPEVLYMQDHGGVNKSVDGGDSWFPIEKGLGAEGDERFGFPMAVARSGELYIFPLKNSEHRVARDGRMMVYRSDDRGESWQPVPGDFAASTSYVNVLRDGMAVDSLEPHGLYFGTSSGDLFYSLDRGTSWSAIEGRFPRITCVKTWLLPA
ncbi:exo-alpha-sialidase [Actinopolymorpha sp. NPDC004070]|uniref:WD40/YVTN/BNR-like repeat-containing protein n=1 Tax=Actinopolymorpha sp. NPDC004070 TaxID=3154548 RepID=UPI0033A18195